MRARVVGGLVAVAMVTAVGSCAGGDVREREEVRALRARLERTEAASPSRLGLVWAMNYVSRVDDVVPDDTPRGWIDDWVMCEAALAQFGEPTRLDQATRGRMAVAVQELNESERAALREVLIDVLLDPLVLGMRDAKEVQRSLAAGGIGARVRAQWRREVPLGAMQQWVDVPARVELEDRGVRVWLHDGSQLVLPN